MYLSGNKLNIQRVSIRLREHAYCPVCQKLVRLVSFSDAGAIFRASEDEIHFLSVKGELHRLHNRSAQVMICTDSLFRYIDRHETRPLPPMAALPSPPSMENNRHD